MTDFISDHYLWIKAFHLIAVISWMAGMLYLPRLFVYHADAEKGSELSETLKIMERKLLRIIINPAMAVTWILGLTMLFANTTLFSSGGWMHVKLTAVVLLSAFHGYLARQRKVFLRDENKKTARFYRQINEIPTVLMILIVILVIVKPF
ncbi:MAG TPA: protoporphyrinogen oxidase HemJ, partial [Alphaproteobacteria bacterium]|jgi:putative membrane protein|nr:protoporphyrinogen oxidase HemJ [Alphaproteobacteria bacterium]